MNVQELAKKYLPEAELDDFRRQREDWQARLKRADEEGRAKLELARQAQRTGNRCVKCEQRILPNAPIYRVYTYFGACGRWYRTVIMCESCGRRREKWRRFMKAKCRVCHRVVATDRKYYPYSPYCSERCAWRFANATRRARAAEGRKKECAVCGHRFQARRRDAKTCSHACRTRLYRASDRAVCHVA